MFDKKRLAVLIDSDNISPDYAPFIMQEVEKYGTATYKRVYGDWRKGGVGWHNAEINYSLLPVQQSSYIAGKNATDFSMIIDAMDILYSGNVDGFCLVTSDSDFTRLALRLREAGMLVVGIGELKTPRAFTVSCHHFCYLNQMCETIAAKDEKTIRQEVLDFVAENGGEVDLAKINAMLVSSFGNINFNEYGYKRISAFIDSFAELERKNTFVSLKKQKKEAIPQVVPVVETVTVTEKPTDDNKTQTPEPNDSKTEFTENNLLNTITQYLTENEFERNNLSKLDLYLAAKYGQIDYKKLGAKTLAKFIDKQSGLKRDGNSVRLSASQMTSDAFVNEAEIFAKNSGSDGGNADQFKCYLINKYGKDHCDVEGFTDFKMALQSVDTIVVADDIIYLKADMPKQEPENNISADAVAETVRAYAEANAPQGGNIGQLNKELMEKYGDNYLADLGFSEYREFLSAMSGVYVKKNHIFIAIVEDSEPEQEQTESPSEENVMELTVAAEEKPDLNTIKRDVLNYVANQEKGGTLTALGKLLSDKYGKTYLKEMGYSSMKKLVTEINGIVIKNNKLYIDKEFAKQTQEIEQFVVEFANSDGKRTVRSLGIKLRQKFDGFDVKNYGFDRFTDFVNAIDGVRADRYYINPEKTEE